MSYDVIYKVNSSLSMTFLTTGAVNKDIKSKIEFAHNHLHNGLRFFDILPNFSFITNTSETMHDYYI